jgi:hypothetical protein
MKVVVTSIFSDWLETFEIDNLKELTLFDLKSLIYQSNENFPIETQNTIIFGKFINSEKDFSDLTVN